MDTMVMFCHVYWLRGVQSRDDRCGRGTDHDEVLQRVVDAPVLAAIGPVLLDDSGDILPVETAPFLHGRVVERAQEPQGITVGVQSFLKVAQGGASLAFPRHERALSPFLIAAASGLFEESLADEASQAGAGDVD
ncbi:hypothetical protein, partial [Streptomyces europaeiscabiei]|uniref:hypothetical protein n=1 Tax=Streptomyces europaeiscabiei TaxID=146819 RepID=UPI0029A25DF6